MRQTFTGGSDGLLADLTGLLKLAALTTRAVPVTEGTAGELESVAIVWRQC